MSARPISDWLTASALLTAYVWLISVIVTLAVYSLMSVGHTYTDFGFGSAALAIMTTLAILLFLPVLSWIGFLAVLSFFDRSRSLVLHVLSSAMAGIVASTLYLLVYFLFRSGDGVGDGYLAFGIVVPLICVFVFPLLATIFKRYHASLRLSALFAGNA